MTLKLFDGIKVPQGSSLTIRAQSTDAMTRGSLVVFRNYSVSAIGTSLSEQGSSVIINSGMVRVTGNAGAATIGGLDTNITINGGSVRANSSSMSDLHLHKKSLKNSEKFQIIAFRTESRISKIVKLL